MQTQQINVVNHNGEFLFQDPLSGKLFDVLSRDTFVDHPIRSGGAKITISKENDIIATGEFRYINKDIDAFVIESILLEPVLNLSASDVAQECEIILEVQDICPSIDSVVSKFKKDSEVYRWKN